MGKPRKQSYFIELVDADTQRRIAVGNFRGSSPSDAITTARRVYARLFASLQTGKWSAHSTEINEKEQTP